MFGLLFGVITNFFHEFCFRARCFIRLIVYRASYLRYRNEIREI